MSNSYIDPKSGELHPIDSGTYAISHTEEAFGKKSRYYNIARANVPNPKEENEQISFLELGYEWFNLREKDDEVELLAVIKFDPLEMIPLQKLEKANENSGTESSASGGDTESSESIEGRD